MGQGMQDKERMNDVLASEKAMTSSYNTFTNECTTAKVRDGFLNILNEEHQLQSAVFDEMQKRGWYPTPPAEQQMIDAAKQKYLAEKP